MIGWMRARTPVTAFPGPGGRAGKHGYFLLGEFGYAKPRVLSIALASAPQPEVLGTSAEIC